MSTLNKLWDGTRYTEEKRGMKEGLDVKAPLLNLIAGTTPAWLSNALPITAWAEGFTSRLMIIYSGERIKTPLFQKEEGAPVDIIAELLPGLRRIHNLQGQFQFTEEVQDAANEWADTDMEPRPDHPKLEYYIHRRDMHFMKLCMAISVSKRSDLVIRIDDYQEAQDMFLYAEKYMGDVFKAMRSLQGDGNVADEAFHFIWQAYAKEQKPISEHRIIAFLMQKLPHHSVGVVLRTMEDGGMIIAKEVDGRGRKAYAPAPRAAH